jgi:heme/copper-type cytochrome/quinol oxidase subunit 2
MSSRRLGLVLVAVGVVGLIGVPVVAGPGPGSSGLDWMASMHERMMGGSRAGRAEAPVPGAPDIEVVTRDFSFSPTELTVPAGTTVNVVLVNDGDLLHDLTIPALGFRLEASPGTRTSSSLTVASQETYPFICSVPGHREAGMEGVVVAT